MDEIPEDVMKAARQAGIAVFDASKFSSDGDPIKVIARAILAERERCAAFAYAKHDWPARWIAAAFRGESSAYADFKPEP